MSPTDSAELALQALMDCHRDANWMVETAMNEAMRRVLIVEWNEAMQLANVAIRVRDAVAERIAILQPMIAAAIAEREQSDRDAGLKHAH